MNVFLLKVTLMPLVMTVVTLVGRKWGNSVGGIIASLPWIAGPILLFFILEQGKAFGIRSVPGILTGIVSLVGFSVTYACLSRRFTGWLTLLMAYAVYLLIALVLSFVALNLWVSYAVALSSIALALWLFPAANGLPSPVRRLPYDLLIRMVVATLFVVGLTRVAAAAGPFWSGILTPFPVITSILALFTHYLQGSGAAVITLRGTVLGLFGFTTFLFLQALFLPRLPVGQSFLYALGINLLISYGTLRLSRANRS